jgi:signal recognition particle GTPase
VKQICAALLASDVNVMLVQKLRTNIKKSVNLEELANSANKKRLIEKVTKKKRMLPCLTRLTGSDGRTVSVGRPSSGTLQTCQEKNKHIHDGGSSRCG